MIGSEAAAAGSANNVDSKMALKPQRYQLQNILADDTVAAVDDLLATVTVADIAVAVADATNPDAAGSRPAAAGSLYL